MKKTFTVLMGLMLFIACSPKFVTPVQMDADRMQTEIPGYTLSDLQTGMEHYKTNCGNCHGLKRPASRTPEEWKKIVPEMVKKANKKEVKISPETEKSILNYLITMGKRK
jgi:hypothetical protein